MTIASEANRSGPYACNGATIHFPFSFRIYDEAHVRVILTDPQGIETTLRLGIDHTVSGVGQSGGGAIDTAIAYASGYRVTLILNVPFTQTVDLENQGAYFAETIERAIDLQTQMSLQLKEQVARSVVLPVTSSVSVDTLTGAVLSLSEIQPQMLTLAPIAEDIVTVAGISGAVVAAEGNANTATAAAGVATSKAAEAAASAAAAQTWDPASYYPKTEFRADGTADAPVKYGALGELLAAGRSIINGLAGTIRRLDFNTAGSIRWSLIAGSEAESGANTGSDLYLRAYDDAGGYLGDVFKVQRSSRALALAQVPTVAGNQVVVKDASGKLPALDGSQLTNLPSLGAGQTLQDVTPFRSILTNYQNTSGKDIVVMIDITGTGNGGIQMWAGASSSLTSSDKRNAMTTIINNYTFISIIKAEEYYRIDGIYAVTVNTWWEYRK